LRERALATLLILVMVVSTACPAIAADISDTKLKEVKFKQLYKDDKEFKKNVDQIRKILIKDKLSDEDWKEFERLFNAVLKKLDRIELSDEEFKVLKETIEKERLKLKAYEYYAQAESLSTAASISIAYDYLPKLYQPTSDINNGNGLIKTYAKVFDENVYGYYLPGKYIIEVTYVFNDEDHPTLDSAYDWYRYIAWGRFEDMETFFLVVDKSTGSISRLSFIGLQIYWWSPFYGEWKSISPIYSGSATWDTAAHERAKIYSFSTTGAHPIIYVNTWNHAMGENDNNPSMADTAFSTWLNPVEGSRMDAENDYSTCVYTDETIVESP